MSYKLELHDLDRDGPVSLTQQLVDRFAAAIEAGELGAGEKLPTTRALAEAAGVNPLTAARVYRRLGELGYVTAHVGRGTFVRSRPPLTVVGADVEDDDWQLGALPRVTASYAEQTMEELFRAGEAPGVISLSASWPPPESFPTALVRDLGERALRERMDDILSYHGVEGLPELREAIAEEGAAHGFASGPDEIVVTGGARQALDLAARALLEPGDVAVTEAPTFNGAVTSLEATGATVLPMPVDGEGADVGALERILARHEVKLVALQSSCQNPTGAVLSPERRARLVELARERSFFVIDDGVYAPLRFDGPRLPSLRSEAPAHVIHVDSVSKTLGGGLRVGWLAAQGPVLARLARLKMNSDMQNPALPQIIVAALLRSGAYASHVEEAVRVNRARRDAMLEALDRHLGDAATWSVPQGGASVWVTFDRPVDERVLYAEALREGTAFLPGGATQAQPTGRTSARLSYSLIDPSLFDEAVRRLARAVRAVHRRERVAALGPLS